MPRLMSAMRPAAFSLGPSRNPRSAEVIFSGSRPATRARAMIPWQQRRARMRPRPWATRMRLLQSSCTTSATVPSATRSSNGAKLGACRPCASNQPASLNPALAASNT